VFDTPKTFCVRNVFSLFAADFSNSCMSAAIDPPQIPLGSTFGLAAGSKSWRANMWPRKQLVHLHPLTTEIYGLGPRGNLA
jgi:hypothetical protein